MYRRKNVAATRFALRRRDLIVLIAGALLPLSAAAQQPDRVRRVGVLMGSRENDPNEQAYAAAFVQGLMCSAGIWAATCSLIGAGPAASPRSSSDVRGN